MKNWETERIANMDLIIMQVALAEIMTFPTIPINVTRMNILIRPNTTVPRKAEHLSTVF